MGCYCALPVSNFKYINFLSLRLRVTVPCFRVECELNWGVLLIHGMIRPGYKIFSKFQVQGQVAIFYSRQESSTLQPKKIQAQARISSFKKVQARILSVNQAQTSKTSIKRFKHCAKTQNISSFNSIAGWI